jgi:AcrR family transcriptional regulator
VADEQAGRRRDAAATKAALLSAARDLFTERGYEQTTVRDIAARAGANQALLFRYFGSKDAVFQAAMASESAQLLTETPAEQLPGEVLRRLFGPDAPKTVDHPMYAVLRSSAHARTASVLREDLVAGYADSLASLTDADDADVRADLVLAWFLGIGLLRSVLEKPPLATADPEHTADLVLRAVRLLLERADPHLPAE